MARRQRYSNSNGDTYESLACTNCPVQTIYDGFDVRGEPNMIQGCEYFNNSDYITRVLENGTWYNIGIPSMYHNMPMYPGGCPAIDNTQAPIDIYSACMICPEENQMGQPNPNKPPIQTAGCTFNNDGSVSTVKVPSGFRGINSWLQTNDCPTTGWNSDGIYVTTNAPSSSGGVSSGGVSSGGVSIGTTRPTKPSRPTKPKKKKRKVKDKNMARKRQLSATGCSSCGSNFTGDSKPCSCGRNPGGSCQCNSGGSSARMGQGVSQPISMPVMASASGKRPNGMPLARENRDCDKRCPHCPDGDISMNNGPCNHRGECCDKRVFTPQGLAPGQRLAFPNNQAIKKYDMLKFSNFVSKVKSNGRKNFVNPSNFGAAEDETFAYNPRVIKNFSTNTKGFFDKSDLNNYSF